MKKLLIGLVAILFSGCIKIYQDIPDKDNYFCVDSNWDSSE